MKIASVASMKNYFFILGNEEISNRSGNLQSANDSTEAQQ